MLPRILLGLFGLLNLGNGLLMLAAPHLWYETVPGVVATGPFNHHFVIDIALAYVASGAFMLAGFSERRGAAAFALAGAAWPALHALFHILGWIADGFPADVINGFLGVALAVWRATLNEGATHDQVLSAQEARRDGARVRL